MVYDSSQDITWLQDANLVKTACAAHAQDPGSTLGRLWAAFDPSALPVGQRSGRTKAQICDDGPVWNGVNLPGGRLNWFEAEAWVALLNDRAYLGYSDWRQPATVQPDTTCSYNFDPGDGSRMYSRYRCAGSELGHLFYSTAPQGLGNPNDLDDNCLQGVASAPDHCLDSDASFTNIEPYIYWSGSDFSPNRDYAWDFNFADGFQEFDNKDVYESYVWPVRDGRSAVLAAQSQAQGIPVLGGYG
ncbi:MAG: DUF1566 domain-containing protein, partial [Cellvibrionaceae bacterium]|nr:DUF1566 domain-containing protein [Cellvibrionaceae bacterium]